MLWIIFARAIILVFLLSLSGFETLKAGAAGDLVAGERKAGVYSVFWDGREGNGQQLSSGVYFYRLQAGAHITPGSKTTNLP